MARPFLIFPAIDLKGGKVVRLRQGQAGAETQYSDDPVSVAKRWEDQGARYLHVVDLDGAFEGQQRNRDQIQAIREAIQIPMQVGGGLRDITQIEEVLSIGVTRVIIGTKACENLDFIAEIVEKYGAKILIGVDVRDGFVTSEGWTARTEWTSINFAKRVSQLGVRTIVFTDVSTDGMLVGPNIGAITEICAAVSSNVIASGGVSEANDVIVLQSLANKFSNLVGVIIGKALYDGRLTLQELAV